MKAALSGITVLLALSGSATAETWFSWLDQNGEVQLTRERPGMGVPYTEFFRPDPMRWSNPPTMPDELADLAPLSAQSLFRQASQSVYWIVSRPKSPGLRAKEERFGSAVAISEDLAMTNCHVIDNPSNEIVIGSARMDAPSSVELVAVNIDADRCVVKGRNLRLRPVAGIRAFDSLQIGEPLYAIGNPQRLQWTISDGLLSGKRIDGEYRWLQTTAPISPGSSGGGLFDSRGNLVGITTKSMVGLWGRNQNLNMAIPAEDFWK